MDSKRRMIEINIWNQAFFSQLDKTEKLFFWFVVTNCDNVGVYHHNPRLVAFHCDVEINLQSFIDIVNFDHKRIELLNDSTLWLKDFVRDTWGTIAAKNNLGVSCYKLLVKHDLLDRFIDEYPNSINIASFREAIKENQKGYGDLPLPQSSPKLDPKQGQTRGKPGASLPPAGTINITTNNNESINESISIPTPQRISSIADRLLKLWPNPDNEIFFEEQAKCEDALKRLIQTGLSLEEAEKLIRMKLKKDKVNGVSLSGLLDGIGKKNIS